MDIFLAASLSLMAFLTFAILLIKLEDRLFSGKAGYATGSMFTIVINVLAVLFILSH